MNEVKTSSAVLWFSLSTVVAIVNFVSATRGGLRWFPLALGLLAAFFAYRWGRLLYARYTERTSRP